MFGLRVHIVHIVSSKMSRYFGDYISKTCRYLGERLLIWRQQPWALDDALSPCVAFRWVHPDAPHARVHEEHLFVVRIDGPNDAERIRRLFQTSNRNLEHTCHCYPDFASQITNYKATKLPRRDFSISAECSPIKFD